jgi:hypothetical protein
MLLLVLLVSFGTLTPLSLPSPSLVPGSPLTLAFAAESAAVRTVDAITLAEGQTEFSFSLTIEHPSPFAGAEMAIQCGDGVEITSVTYSPSVSQAGPKDARGFTWFGFFSGDNNFAGTVTATIYATYSGSENTSLVVDHASFYSKTGGSFSTQNLALRKSIALNRQGADNPPPPLDPPDTGGDNPGGDSPNNPGTPSTPGDPGSPNTPGSGNPPSGALVTYTPPTNGAANAGAAGGTGAGGTGTGTGAGADDPSTNAASASGDGQTDPNNPSTTLPSGQTPLSAPDSTNNIPEDGARHMDRTLLNLAVILLTAAAVLGFLVLVKNRRKQN